MYFTVLGSLSAQDNEQPIVLGGRNLRIVLAMFLCAPNQPVGVSSLLDAVWDENPPKTAAKNLQVYVYQLRQLLGNGRVLRTGHGYSLAVAPGELDAELFRELVTRAMAISDPAKARGLLAEAESLWRGPAFADLADAAALREPIALLTEQRLSAIQARVDLDLILGLHQALVPELGTLTTRYPLQERLRGQLMIALFRSGRQGDALHVYQETRALLADELGIEPTQELQDLHLAILRGTDPGPSRHREQQRSPAQLPPPVAHFSGRAKELAQLDALLDSAAQQSATVVISPITGMGGIGKTALAVRWAHKVAEHFPHGQLYLNLRGYDVRQPVEPAEALAQLLRSLGVAPERVPSDVDEATALYRSTLAGQKVLILLDNARSAEQVRPLIPSGKDNVVLVTSRDGLAGLIARDGAHRLGLGTLTSDEAMDLLKRFLGRDRVAAEPEATAELAAAAGYVPLALCIAAANLATQPGQSIAGFAASLVSHNRLTALSIEGDPATAMRAVFDLSYAALPADQQAFFRLIGLVPGPDLTARAAAALTQTSLDEAHRHLRSLADAHLVTEHLPGRYLMHDLLREYARQQTVPAAAQALERLFSHYLTLARSAAETAAPSAARLPPIEPSAGPKEAFADPALALEWLTEEHANLVAAIRHAAAHGPARFAWQLADVIRGYFWIRRHLLDWTATATAGLEAAVAHNDSGGQAAMHLSLGIAHRSTGDMPTAIEHLTLAIAFAGQAGWPEGQASATSSIGAAYADAGDAPSAIKQFTQALELNRKIGRVGGVAVTLGNIAALLLHLGDLRQAVVNATEALALYQQTANRIGEGVTHLNLGIAHRQLGHLTIAHGYLQQALEINRELGDRGAEAITLTELAEVNLWLGDFGTANGQAVAAEELTAVTGDRQHQAIALIVLAHIHCREGSVAQAVEVATQALDITKEIGNRLEQATALDCLAQVLHRQNDTRQALSHAREAVTIANLYGYRIAQAKALTTLAELELADGDADSANKSAAQALDLCEDTGYEGVRERAAAISAAP